MKIGLPRAFLYFKYKDLWETFFRELDCDIELSEETNKKILADGINLSIDESCLPAKIYMGHVQSLIGICDYILMPRIKNFGYKEIACVKFNAMYDIANNTFENLSLLDYNIDVQNGESEWKGFIKMGKMLGKSYIETFKAYQKAKKAQKLSDNQRTKTQDKYFDNNDNLKILVVSHPYNLYDKLMGYPVIEYIKKLGALPIYSDAAGSKRCIKESKKISTDMYWTYNKELIGAIEFYKNKIDGIILLPAFPCGPDSLVNELVLRKVKEVPIINIVLDELQGEAGIQTRIESFIDILNEKRRKKREWNIM